jgi:hypothetical protein
MRVAGSVLPTWIGIFVEEPKPPERSPASTMARAIAAPAAAARKPIRGAGDHHGREGSGTQALAGTGIAKLFGAGTVGIARRTLITERSSSVSRTQTSHDGIWKSTCAVSLALRASSRYADIISLEICSSVDLREKSFILLPSTTQNGIAQAKVPVALIVLLALLPALD